MERITVIQLSARLGVEYALAAALLKLMLLKGVATEVGKVKTSASGKGKPSTLYEIPASFTVTFDQKMEQVAA